MKPLVTRELEGLRALATASRAAALKAVRRRLAIGPNPSGHAALPVSPQTKASYRRRPVSVKANRQPFQSISSS
jgi:hypothetical protein